MIHPPNKSLRHVIIIIEIIIGFWKWIYEMNIDPKIMIKPSLKSSRNDENYGNNRFLYKCLEIIQFDGTNSINSVYYQPIINGYINKQLILELELRNPTDTNAQNNINSLATNPYDHADNGNYGSNHQHNNIQYGLLNIQYSALEYCELNNGKFVHPFDDYDVIMGQTIAQEIYCDLNDLYGSKPDIIISTVGGDVLISDIKFHGD
eukprot:238632_1